ncbi:hypothetical protein ACFRCI_48800 [Streptomyces sp. NPDC056638]|uniref:hypothetical protein n=1 Tax=Streptomyces sp. NPDC056638 TaxID=3345887 RepID=UPI0036D0ADDE
MVNLVEQSISQAMDEPDDRMMFTRIKDIVARYLRRMDPGATVTKTEFFNHTHVPDMVLEWPGRPRTSRRFIYLRTTSDQRELENDLQPLPRADRPVLLALGQLPSTRQQGDLPPLPGSSTALLLDASALGALQRGGDLPRQRRDTRRQVAAQRVEVVTQPVPKPVQTRLGEQPLLIGLGHQPSLRVSLTHRVRPPRVGVGLGGRRGSQHPGNFLPVRLSRAGGPAALFRAWRYDASLYATPPQRPAGAGTPAGRPARLGSGPTTLPTATERTGQRRLPAERIRDDNLLNVSPKDQAVLQLRGDEPRLGRVVAGDMSVGSRRTAGRRVS